MFSHICIGVSDFPRALAFYQPIMALLGIELRFLDEHKPWAAWQSKPEPRPLLLIGKPHDGAPHHPGNGQMVALLAQNRAQVEQAHRLALAHGGAVKGRRGCAPSITRIITVPTFATRTATSSAWSVTSPSEEPLSSWFSGRSAALPAPSYSCG